MVTSAKLLAVAAMTAAATVLFGSNGSFGMPADAQRPENRASVDVGGTVAHTYCAPCHAIGPRGRSSNPKAPRFPLIAERYPNDNPAGVLVDGTVVRHPGMPEFRMLEYETDGLVAYLRRVSRKYRPGKQ